MTRARCLTRFALLEIPLLNGRDFNDRDTLQSPPVAIVSRAFVRQSIPDNEPNGRTVRLWRCETSDVTNGVAAATPGHHRGAGDSWPMWGLLNPLAIGAASQAIFALADVVTPQKQMLCPQQVGLAISQNQVVEPVQQDVGAIPHSQRAAETTFPIDSATVCRHIGGRRHIYEPAEMIRSISTGIFNEFLLKWEWVLVHQPVIKIQANKACREGLVTCRRVFKCTAKIRGWAVLP